MSLQHYLNRIRRTDALIRRRSTGPPSEFARRLGISERWLYVFLDELRRELDCPIKYCRHSRSYIYKRKGTVTLGFEAQTDEPRENFETARDTKPPSSVKSGQLTETDNR